MAELHDGGGPVGLRDVGVSAPGGQELGVCFWGGVFGVQGGVEGGAEVGYVDLDVSYYISFSVLWSGEGWSTG